MSAAAASVELEHFGFRYQGAEAPALRDVSLRFSPGECVVLCGRSGCGKTTLTRAVNGLIPLAYRGERSGQVRIGGKPLEEHSSSELAARVGSVFQNPRSQFVNSEVVAELAFACENQGTSRDEMVSRIHDAASDLGICPLLGRRAQELSGGQRQLVMLAAAHVAQADVYVLDEPTAALDIPSMRLLARALARLKATGKTLIVSEHRLWWLRGLADRVIRMEDGLVAGSWGADEFARIPRETRACWGLRAFGEDDLAAQLRQRGWRTPEASPSPREDGGLEARGLALRFQGGAQALAAVGLQMGRGRILGIVGRNGSGKTTLARCLCGLEREQEGQVLLDGRPLSPRMRLGRSYLVMQEPGYQLFEDSVMAELVQARMQGQALAGRHAPNEADDDVQRLMGALGIGPLAKRHPLSLSGGQRQRVSVAAGMLFSSEAMVLDEPTSGLDADGMRRMASQLEMIRASGKSVAVISHDLEFLSLVCDEVVRMSAGRAGPPLAVCSSTLPQLREALGFQSHESL